MKVLVATRATQRAPMSDSCDCLEGELVWMLDPCPASRRNPDGKCGCGRSFSGLSSHGYTTTALVREIPGLSRAEYEGAVTASFEAQGWCACCTRRPVPEIVDELMQLACVLPGGTVVERRLDVLTVRVHIPAAEGGFV